MNDYSSGVRVILEEIDVRELHVKYAAIRLT